MISGQSVPEPEAVATPFCNELFLTIDSQGPFGDYS